MGGLKLRPAKVQLKSVTVVTRVQLKPVTIVTKVQVKPVTIVTGGMESAAPLLLIKAFIEKQ